MLPSMHAEVLAEYLGANSTADHRTSDWFMMSSYWPTLLITVFYLFAVWLGPKLMAKHRPWKLTEFTIIYNLCLVVFSLWLCIEIFQITILNSSFDKACSPVNYSDDPMAKRLAAATWWFYISKGIEYTDTIIFILRKKNAQISFLHVYHHSTIFSLWWFTTKYIAGGAIYSGMLINTAVHTIMYFYYMLAAMGDRVKSYLWWKRYITKIQLLQFFLLFMHTVYLLYARCDFPVGYSILLLLWDITLIILFANFYIKAYTRKLRKD